MTTPETTTPVETRPSPSPTVVSSPSPSSTAARKELHTEKSTGGDSVSDMQIAFSVVGAILGIAIISVSYCVYRRCRPLGMTFLFIFLPYLFLLCLCPFCIWGQGYLALSHDIACLQSNIAVMNILYYTRLI